MFYPSSLKQTRKPCRSTQTPRAGARNPNRSFLTGESDNDSDDDHRFLFPPRPRPGSRNSSNPSLKRKRGPGGPRSPSRQSRGSRPGSRHGGLKKGASAAALDSESEESGYGETYYTMHASSFDNVLDDTVFDDRTPINTTMRGTPLGLENHFSDGDSTVSYLSTQAYGANPEDLRDAMCQTPGHTSTQTPAEWRKNKARVMQTQTGSNTSLHSIGNQTRRSSGSRADLLKSILMEVKGLKQQRGLDNSSYNGTDDDASSVRSDRTIKKETLEHVLSDVREIREADATGTAATQTVQEEGTQTSMKIFPEGDPIRHARLEKFKTLMDDVKDMKGSRPGTPGSRSRASTRSETPVGRPRGRTPTRLNATFESPMQNGYPSHTYPQQPMYPPQNLNSTAPVVMMHPPQPMPQPQYLAGRRLVTQDDLNNISQRLQRLSEYQTPHRPNPPPPPPQPQYVVPVYAAPPRRKPPPDDAYLSDESEYGDAPPPRRRRARPDLEDALEEASRSALQLKRLSKRMKDSLRDDMRYL